MSTEVAVSNPAEAFRQQASNQLHAVADMSLHALVDEFVRLSKAIEAGVIRSADKYGSISWTEEAQLAGKQRSIVNGAVKARFGISLQTHDRDDPEGF